jgi:flavin reductase (DIM6/NTAB) family NADH-FMN oxidoreductase RutF
MKGEDMPWGDPRSVKFITNVGLITSRGPFGENVMACEFTHHINYKPSVIVIGVNPKDATHDNISKTKEFGVSLAAFDQGSLASLAGGNTARKIDKIKFLKKIGFKFFKARKIKTLMVKDAVMHAECKLIKKIRMTDHTIFIGSVQVAYIKRDVDPLVYHKGKYLKVGKQHKKPSKAQRKKWKELAEKFGR